jgi:ribosome-associated protein
VRYPPQDDRPRGASDKLTPLEQAQRIAALAQEKLAKDITILDMRPVCSYTDFFVICTGQNPRQTKAIYDEVHERLKADARAIPHNVDGAKESTWILADYLDVVLHVFTPEARAYYRLEELWGDVPSVEVEVAAAAR